MTVGKELSWILLAYLLGCFTTGYYWMRWRTGQDIRQHGSGNVGARNVGRLVGPGGFVVTLGLDAAKGAVAVLAAQQGGVSEEALLAVLLAVVAGHIWPWQLGFAGGKGVATSLGALLAYDPSLLGVLALVFVSAFALLREFTLSGLLAYVLAPLVLYLSDFHFDRLAAMSLLAVLVVLAHRGNVRQKLTRLFHGPEAAETPKPAREGTHEH